MLIYVQGVHISNHHISKVDLEMVSNYMNMCSASVLIRELQIKTTIYCIYDILYTYMKSSQMYDDFMTHILQLYLSIIRQ